MACEETTNLQPTLTEVEVESSATPMELYKNSSVVTPQATQSQQDMQMESTDNTETMVPVVLSSEGDTVLSSHEDGGCQVVYEIHQQQQPMSPVILVTQGTQTEGKMEGPVMVDRGVQFPPAYEKLIEEVDEIKRLLGLTESLQVKQVLMKEQRKLRSEIALLKRQEYSYSVNAKDTVVTPRPATTRPKPATVTSPRPATTRPKPATTVVRSINASSGVTGGGLEHSYNKPSVKKRPSSKKTTSSQPLSAFLPNLTAPVHVESSPLTEEPSSAANPVSPLKDISTLQQPIVSSDLTHTEDAVASSTLIQLHEEPGSAADPGSSHQDISTLQQQYISSDSTHTEDATASTTLIKLHGTKPVAKEPGSATDPGDISTWQPESLYPEDAVIDPSFGKRTSVILIEDEARFRKLMCAKRTCGLCYPPVFKNRSKLTKHVENVHLKHFVLYQDKKALVCKLRCLEDFMHGHYHCPHCSLIFKKKYLLINHFESMKMKLAKKNAAALIQKKQKYLKMCKVCNQTLQSKHFSRHMRGHDKHFDALSTWLQQGISGNSRLFSEKVKQVTSMDIS